MSERLWKILAEDRLPHHCGKGQWPEPGEWLEVGGPLVECKNGLHLCRDEDLVHWLGPVVWEAEADGERIDGDDKIVVRRARLVRQADAWNERTARIFACDCAEHVQPDDADPRSIEAIRVARRFADGGSTEEELAAAWAAAWDAARDGARAAAWSQAWDASWEAARAAAWSAARDGAWAAARAAAKAAAWSAADAAEREWQTAELTTTLHIATDRT